MWRKGFPPQSAERKGPLMETPADVWGGLGMRMRLLACTSVPGRVVLAGPVFPLKGRGRSAGAIIGPPSFRPRLGAPLLCHPPTPTCFKSLCEALAEP